MYRVIFLHPSGTRAHAEAELGLFLGQVAAQRRISRFKWVVVFFELVVLDRELIIISITDFLPLDLK